MALVKKAVSAHVSAASDLSSRSSAAVTREAEAQRKRARTHGSSVCCRRVEACF
jgi:hypothetical protein